LLTNDTSLSAQQLAELSSTNTQSAQMGNRLYIHWWIRCRHSRRFPNLQRADGDRPARHHSMGHERQRQRERSMRSIHDNFAASHRRRDVSDKRPDAPGSSARIFTGGYPNGTGVYTQQVRSFDIVDDGANLSIAKPDGNDAGRCVPSSRPECHSDDQRIKMETW